MNGDKSKKIQSKSDEFDLLCKGGLPPWCEGEFLKGKQLAAPLDKINAVCLLKVSTQVVEVFEKNCHILYMAEMEGQAVPGYIESVERSLEPWYCLSWNG